MRIETAHKPRPFGGGVYFYPGKTRALQARLQGSKLGEAKDRRFKANQITRFLEIWLVLTKRHIKCLPT
jgi:hypothetical protein